MKRTVLLGWALALAGCLGRSATEGPSPVAAKEAYVVTNGVRLHYLEWGSVRNPTILILPGTGGFGGVASQWSMFAQRFAQDFHVVAVPA